MISQRFDEYVQSHPQETRDAISFLYKEMAEHNCMFGKDLIPTFIKPVFFTQRIVENTSSVLDTIVTILEKMTRLYFQYPELKNFFYINGVGEKLVEVDPGFSRNIVICRPDAFLVNDILRFVEFNCDSPAGAGYSDSTEAILHKTEIFRTLSQPFDFSPFYRCEYLLKALLSAYKEFSGKEKPGRIAIVDWKEVRTYNEFVILKTYFESQGIETVIADPREFKYLNGKLFYKEQTIDLIYRRVIFKELVERINDVQAFLKAYKDGKVCVVNPLRSRLASNKAILSIITNQRKYKGFFSAEENRVIHRHIPWTRRVIDIETTFENNKIFLLKHIASHKDNLVLKPGDSYGGKDVVIGKECSQNDWEALILRILKKDEDWVVQRYVEITKTTVPVLKDNRLEIQTKKYNINPFVFGGRYAGSVARLSDQSVINVSAGGGLVPVVPYIEKTQDTRTKTQN